MYILTEFVHLALNLILEEASDTWWKHDVITRLTVRVRMCKDVKIDGMTSRTFKVICTNSSAFFTNAREQYTPEKYSSLIDTSLRLQVDSFVFIVQTVYTNCRTINAMNWKLKGSSARKVRAVYRCNFPEDTLKIYGTYLARKTYPASMVCN